MSSDSVFNLIAPKRTAKRHTHHWLYNEFKDRRECKGGEGACLAVQRSRSVVRNGRSRKVWRTVVGAH